MTKHQSERSIRIIGGNWRSRKISFPNRGGIRPTPDRVRETLFNWLAPYIAGSRCLELYAGSGVLSMEALSRGARHVTLIERDQEAWQWLVANLARLCGDESRYTCTRDAALHWLPRNRGAFDIVFLDPPFDSDELGPALAALVSGNALVDGSLVYLETPVPVDASTLPAGYSMIRQKRAGQVHYCLCELQR